MKNRLLSRLLPKDPPSYARIADFIATMQPKWEALADESKPTFSQYAAQKLLDHFGISKLLDAKLLKFGEHCLKWHNDPPISSRLIVCGSKASIIDPKSGDTILTPEGVWQIDSDFQEQLLLSKTDMERYIPKDLRPNENTRLDSQVVSDNQTKDANDSPIIENSKRLSTALNQAILAKGHGLYLSSQTSTQRTASTIQIVHIQHVTPAIQNRGLVSRLLQQLQLKSDIQFFFLAHQYSESCLKFFLNRKLRSIENPVSADDLIEYQYDVLSRKLELYHLSDTQLKELAYLSRTYDPKLSPRIICGGSSGQVNQSVVLRTGDTIILPDVIVQIDYADNRRCFLDKKAIAADPVLSQYTPSINTDVSIMTTEENPTLAKALNLALQNKTPSALFLGAEISEKAKEKIDFQQTVSAVIQTELDRRQTKDLLILRTLGLKNDTEFIDYWTSLCSDFLDTSRIQNSQAKEDTVVRADFADYTTKKIEQCLGTNLKDLSDTKLRLLRKQCEVWSPKISPRILCCSTIPEDYQIGDTLILPDGVYQMRMNSAGKIIKETIIDARSMTHHLDLLKHHPTTPEEVLILDHHSKTPQEDALQSLRQSLNAIIRNKPKGMYLGNITNNLQNSYGAIPIALKKIVEVELHTRLLNQYQNQHTQTTFLKFSGFFQSSNKTMPSASSQMSTQQLRAAADLLRSLQNTDQLVQRVTPSPAAMLIHSLVPAKRPRILNQVESAIKEVIQILEITGGGNSYKPLRDEKKQTIQVFDRKSNVLCMEASTESVVVYQPLLKANMDDVHKAELFLQALGVPPASGKPDIVVRGGHSSLRKAIRQLFREYQHTEQSGSESTQSDTDSFSSRK